MSEELHIPKTDNRADIYEALLPQIKALVEGEKNFTANVANTMAALKEAFGFLWVGCYFVDTENPDELVLGPFQGPIACTRIKKGKGVCGTAWLQNQTMLVQDVEQFPGHIACSSLSKSEIVVPLRKSDNTVFGVLDLDSEHLNDFSEIDSQYLEEIAVLLGEVFYE